MKIKSVRTRVFEWKGKVVPPQARPPRVQAEVANW